MKTILRAAAATLMAGAALAAASGTQAATFGAATAAVAILGSPTVTLGLGSGTASFDSPAAIFSTTGSLTQASGFGFASGTIDFSELVGTVVPDTIDSLLTFADKTGGDYVFDITSAQTTSFASVPGTSTSIGLYLLGSASDTNLGLTPSPTSITLTLNQTGNSAYSASATIDAPPSSVSSAPEPASWALMFAGVALVGGALRHNRGRRLAVAVS